MIDGFHKGHVLDLPNPTPVITLLKPKALTYCDCDGPETFEHQAQEIDYKVAFTSPDGDVALFSTTWKIKGHIQWL